MPSDTTGKLEESPTATCRVREPAGRMDRRNAHGPAVAKAGILQGRIAVRRVA
jgi:hypothetical protein